MFIIIPHTGTSLFSFLCLLFKHVQLPDFLSVYQGLKVLFVSTRLLHMSGKKKLLMIFLISEWLESNLVWTVPTQAQLFDCSHCPLSNCSHKGEMPMLCFVFFLSLFMRVPTGVSWGGANALPEALFVLNEYNELILNRFHDQHAEVLMMWNKNHYAFI